jgi:hypothetical protein
MVPDSWYLAKYESTKRGCDAIPSLTRPGGPKCQAIEEAGHDLRHSDLSRSAGRRRIGVGDRSQSGRAAERFHARDAKLEHLAWALKAEMDDGFRTSRVYAEALGGRFDCGEYSPTLKKT